MIHILGDYKAFAEKKSFREDFEFADEVPCSNSVTLDTYLLQEIFHGTCWDTRIRRKKHHGIGNNAFE